MINFEPFKEPLIYDTLESKGIYVTLAMPTDEACNLAAICHDIVWWTTCVQDISG